MSVLETFVHDPLVDWTRHDNPRASTEVENPQAQEVITIVQGTLLPLHPCQACYIAWSHVLASLQGLSISAESCQPKSAE